MRGWAGLAAYVVAYESFAALTGREVLTGEFRGTLADHPILVTAVATYVLGHLYGVWPSRLDPLHLFVTTLERLTA